VKATAIQIETIDVVPTIMASIITSAVVIWRPSQEESVVAKAAILTIEGKLPK
jgi:hypothetical protein